MWDLGRLFRFATEGDRPEEIIVDLAKDFGGPVPALPAYMDDASYSGYLMVLPGETLAEIYDRWGTRLLEQNVRVFLQARGKSIRGFERLSSIIQQCFLRTTTACQQPLKTLS